MRKLKILFLAGAGLLAVSCYSGPVKIADDATAAEITQMGQEAMDRERYKQAIQYYEAIRERFAGDPSEVCGADYEIAFIHYKQRKYQSAKDEFTEIVSRFDGSGARTLPRKYLILSKKVLEKIEEKQKADKGGQTNE